MAERSTSAAPGDRILFVTWDGPGLSYLESLFVPIFAGLADHGHHFDVLQFRWGPAMEEARARAACEAAGIGYRSTRVLRVGGGLGPMLSAVTGGQAIRRAIRAFGSTAVMPRSTLPALACVHGGIAAKWPVVFDADGLEVDERAEFDALDPMGAAYRILRDAEAQMVRQAAVVLTRTGAAGDVLAARGGPGVRRDRIFTVANGRDPARFHPFDARARAAVRARLGIGADVPLVGYVGGTGHKYDTPAIARFALALRARHPDTRLLVMSGAPGKAADELGLAGNPVLAGMTQVLGVAPEMVPDYLAAVDIGTAFGRPSFATAGVSPIKVGEYLLCGVPLVGTARIGNNAAAVEGGVYLDEVADMDRAAAWAGSVVLANREEMRQRARRCGIASYSLDRSVADYRAALAHVGGDMDLGEARR
jgi:glycosyltransferase involved in cell wall biosynthesis